MPNPVGRPAKKPGDRKQPIRYSIDPSIAKWLRSLDGWGAATAAIESALMDKYGDKINPPN